MRVLRVCAVVIVALSACEGAFVSMASGSPEPVQLPPSGGPATPAGQQPAPLCDPSTRDVGRVTLRRLNRYEYNATVRDLLGDTSRPADDFPADDFGHGFDNQGDVLSTAPLLVEKYEAAARKLVETALAAEYQPGATVRVEAETATASTGAASGSAWNLYSNGTLTQSVTVPMGGAFTFRARVWQQAAGPDPARMRYLVDGRSVGEVDVTNTAAQTLTQPVTLTAGPHTIGVEFTNDYYQDPEDRNLLIDWLELDKPAAGTPGAGARILVCDPTTGAACVRSVLERFGRKAWRRPLTSEEVDRYVAVVAVAQAEGEPVQAGLTNALQALLLSPHFLFRVEADDGDTAPRALSDHELATRLSYFLWGSMPDDELSALADQGALRPNLDAQVRRMLADSRSEALVTQFAGSWLWSRSVDEASPDPTLFPSMTAPLKAALRQETEAFVRSFLQEDRSALELVQSDDMFVSDVTAAHYGVPAPGSAAMVRLRQVPEGRGGLLGHAGLLTVTSQPNRTSPVKRGKWVLAQLLCTEPPPPPANVEAFVPSATPTGTLREQMEAHRSKAECAGCHNLMDPIGFGLENFDAIGRYRTVDTGGFPIDASGTLYNGKSFAGPRELATLVKEDDRFPLCVTMQLFTYALGRAPSTGDACAVAELNQAFAAKGHRLSELVVALVQSESFTHRRGESP
ncbi:MAG: DUF1592 domain-containing protein [Myxococcota bacterium]